MLKRTLTYIQIASKPTESDEEDEAHNNKRKDIFTTITTITTRTNSLTLQLALQLAL